MASSGGAEESEQSSGAPSNGRRLALVSVSDKRGIVEFARALARHGYVFLSTGGTARVLRDADLDVTEVSEFTGSPEIMGGRVKTLHPRIHGGLLGRDGVDEALMEAHDIRRIDMLVLNLYPFEQVTANPDCSLEDAIENIDIGGPAMLRSAAKNFPSVAVVTAPDQYADVLSALETGGGALGLQVRYRLAVAAFNRVARYDDAISNWLSARDHNGDARRFPDQANAAFVKVQELRYGENPHQQAAWYRDCEAGPEVATQVSTGTLSDMRQVQGKALSFNNIADADAAWQCVAQFNAPGCVIPSCVIIKHANPCGVATADTLAAAYERAFATDPTSAFGGIIAFNGELDQATASEILERQFVELIMAPGFTADALSCLAGKPNVRVLEMPGEPSGAAYDARRVSGGVLVQSTDTARIDRSDCRVVSARAPDEAEWADLLFAWKVAKMVKSNAIVYAAGERTLGIGAGQMSRVDSARIAAWKAQDAGLSLTGSAMASDAFFPFRDGIDTAAESGIRSVIQPGGSKHDDEIIAAANAHDIAMVFTGIRHFRH